MHGLVNVCANASASTHHKSTPTPRVHNKPSTPSTSSRPASSEADRGAHPVLLALDGPTALGWEIPPGLGSALAWRARVQDCPAGRDHFWAGGERDCRFVPPLADGQLALSLERITPTPGQRGARVGGQSFRAWDMQGGPGLDLQALRSIDAQSPPRRRAASGQQ